MPINHAFTSVAAEGADATKVRTSNWNANHAITGSVNFPNAAVPSVPGSGLEVWARSRAGRTLLEVMGPSGLNTFLQPALFGNNIVMWLPGTGTTVAINFGSNWTARNAGTGAVQAHPAPASTNLLTSIRRATFGTGTTATGSSGTQGAAAQFWRGNAADRGGFYFFARCGIETWGASSRIFIGLSALNAALSGEPSAQNNSLVFGIDSGDTNLQFISRDGSTATKVDLGLAPASGQVFDFVMFAKPNDTEVTIYVVRRDSAAVLADNVVVTATLPVSTVFLYPHAQIMSTAGATAKVLMLNRLYIESDY